ncbi:MAG: CHAD domain-containing protein [Candidatus Riflebacteria bacterium]|nr:CHAD domain-containing protein [Candidatus Riflebacteria bacterium]
MVSWGRRILGGDTGVETIHQARVGTRRLRTALGLLGCLLPARAHRSLSRAARHSARALGVVRDADTFLEHLASLRPAGDSARAAALRHVRDQVRDARRRGFPIMLERLREFAAAASKSGLIGRDRPEACQPKRRATRKAAEPARVDTAGAAARGPQSPDEDVPALLRRPLADLLARFLAHRKRVVGRRCDHRSAHEMRIAAKHLRYAIEMAAEACSSSAREKFEPVLKAAVQVQGTLGHVHDRHVWRLAVRSLRRRLRAEGAGAELLRGLRELSRAERAQRCRLLEHFRGRWNVIEQSGIFPALARELESQ